MRHQSTGSWQGGALASLRFPGGIRTRTTMTGRFLDGLVRGLGLIAAAFVMSGGLVLVVRRFAGAIPAAAQPAVLLAATLTAAALVLTVDAAVRAGSRPGLAVLARCGLAAGAAGLLVPPRATGPMEWATLLAAATVLGAVIVRAPRRGRHAAGEPTWISPRFDVSRRRRSASLPPAPAAPPRPDMPPLAPLPGVDDGAGGLVRQRFERRESADGADSLVGQLSIAVPTGAKLASGHVGFCPSFREVPSVEVTTEYDGVEAVVSVGELVPWGVRIDCRLAEPAEEDLEIPVVLTARAGG